MFLRQIISLSFVFILTGCVTDGGPIDTAGRSVKLGKLGSFEPDESRFNTFRFLEPTAFYKTNAIQRDNGRGWIETIKARKMFFEVQHMTDAWFSRFVEDDMLEGESFRSIARKHNIDEENFVKLDEVGSRLKGWVAYQGKCVAGAFSKRLKPRGPYDDDRGYADTAVRFGGCAYNFKKAPEQIARDFDFLDQADIAALHIAYEPIGPLNHDIEFPDGERFGLSGEWKGVAPEIMGYAAPMGKDHFSFHFSIEQTGSACVGTVRNSNGEQSGRTWTLRCDDGRTAGGLWMMRKNRPLIASGSDDQKQPVLFRITQE